MKGHVIRLPGELHQVLADRLDKLVREITTTPDWARDHLAQGETVEITVVRRPAVKAEVV